MAEVRFARNCFDAAAWLPTRCECCGAIKLLVVDDRDRIRAVVDMSVDELREVIAEYDAGKLTPFNAESDDGESERLH